MKKTTCLFLLMILFAFNSCKESDITDNDVSDTVTDIDGNIYHTVTIGTQVWMVENLKTTKYKNGDPIPNVTDDANWNNLTSGAYCNYANNTAIGEKYGRLYNWWVISDSRGIAPKGWRIPSYADWSTLYDYVSANIGTSLNEYKALASKTDWVYVDKSGLIGNDLSINNSSGFTALPGGGTGSEIGTGVDWWGNYDVNTQNTTVCYLYEYNLGNVDKAENRFELYLVTDLNFQSTDYLKKSNGLYIRCIKGD